MNTNQTMFCYQCQETAGQNGCTRRGVCGKTPEVAARQDLLIYVTKGLAAITTAMRREKLCVPAPLNHQITENLFLTITNVSFDSNALEKNIQKTADLSVKYRALLSNPSALPKAAFFACPADFENIPFSKIGVQAAENEDIRSLRELLTYGLKGMAAYNRHANVLGFEKEEIDAFLQSALADTLNDSMSVSDLTALTLEAGKYGVEVMALLDQANTQTYGNPQITKVSTGVRNNPAVLISGHDLRDLEMLLAQTENSGVDVYTHCEMLPAHYYPAFKKYPHFVGNYGNAWWKQTIEFEAFHGPILLTTNCLVPPKDSYRDRLYTTGPVGFSGCKHISADENGNKDFSDLIRHARQCPPPAELENGEIIGGFAHNQVLALADKVVAAIKSGAIRRFVVMAGCDGRSGARSYYQDFAKALPDDTVILTAGCAKYKYNKLGLGHIGGIPRVLDAGQCNDSYSLAIIALKLKEVFGLDDINELPIVYNISWYEQKAVIVLLALLHLGVKNIHLGPTLPAFLSPNVAKLLTDTFGIAGITTVEKDMEIFGL